MDETFKVMPLTMSLKGQAFFDRFEPYAEAGIGVYFIKDEINGTILGISDRTPRTTRSSVCTSALAETTTSRRKCFSVWREDTYG